MQTNRFLFIIALLIFTACGNNTETSDNKPVTAKEADTMSNKKDLILCPDCDNGNIEIPEVKAKRMIDSFSSIYRKEEYDKQTIPKYFWIDACYIKTMLAYISNHPQANIDGVRFYLGTDKNRNDKVQLFISPTRQRHALWPNDISTAGGCTPIFGNYENDPGGIATPMMKSFNKIHRHKPFIGDPRRDSLSIGVWFKTCVLECISNTIRNNQNLRLNGVNVYNAAYYEMSGNVTGQKHTNQSTMVIVFTKLNEMGETVDDFSIGETLFKKRKKDWNALNHGELCPKACDEQPDKNKK
jgi:hypothetical protein